MSTKTIQFVFKIGSTLTDVTSVVLRDVTNTFGIRRTDTLAVVVASGTALTRLSTGLYSYTFTEPASGLNYEYVIEYVYGGNTKRLRQVLVTGTGGSIPLAPTAYTQMGVDTVACGDATLSAFLTNQANLVWAMQARRGVALDLQYQYYVSDLIVIAMDHVRMLIDTETGDSDMHDNGAMDALSTSTANASTSKTRTSSFTESSSSAQSWTRTASRTSSASSRLQTSNSANRSASQADYSTMSQSASGSSSRTQSGSSTATGNIASDGTSGRATSNSTASTISRTLYEGGYLDGSGMPPGLVSQYKSFSAALAFAGGAGAGGGINWSTGNSAIYHQVTPSVLGRINASGAYDPEGAEGDYSLKNTSTAEHGRNLTGTQTGSGSSTFTSSGSRVNNRSGSSSASANSSILGNSSSTLTSTSHEQQSRTASSASHSESAYRSTMTATSTSHRESLGTDTMTASGNIDRDYYSQIFDSLKMMWDETQEAIRRLESQMLLTTRYLVDKLTVVTSQASLVTANTLPTDPRLIQRPGVPSGNTYSPFNGSFNRWIVR